MSRNMVVGNMLFGEILSEKQGDGMANGGMGGDRIALGAFVDVLNHTSPTLSIRQNSAGVRSSVYLMYPTLYASPLITFNRNGYTKHYFEGSNRVCSKIGGGFGEVTWDQLTDTVPCISGGYVHLTQQQWTSVRQTFEGCLNTNVDMNGAVDLYEVVWYEQGRTPQPEPAFYYHSDHLGSAAYLTNELGEVTQTLNYLPYGEDWVDIQHNLDPNLGQYSFNGKEKDYESGFHYYGARYYWSEVLTGWLSVDALTDSFPNLSSYSYCRNNPVKLVEPDGNFPIETILDVGFLVYDVGAAVVNHIQGNHAAAVDHWVNAGADVVAVATPYAPAMATRTAVKGIRQGTKTVQKTNEIKNTSRAARRDVMRKEGIPTSQQPQSQRRTASGSEYTYEIPGPYETTQIKSVQQKTKDSSHPNDPHWEAGSVKMDRNGDVSKNRYGTPRLCSGKSKTGYSE